MREATLQDVLKAHDRLEPDIVELSRKERGYLAVAEALHNHSLYHKEKK